MENQTETTAAKSKGKVVGIIIDVVLILAIILALFCTYTAFVTKSGSGVPKIFGVEFFAIQSDSMAPTFNEGDLIIDKAIKDTDDLEVGDVITFWTIIYGYRVLNTHRIVDMEVGENFTYFYTKGDNNSSVDPITVHESEVVGIYKSHISGLGKVLDFLQTGTGFFCVIVLPVLAFFIYYLTSFFRTLFEYKKAKNRLEFEQEQNQKAVSEVVSAPASDTVSEAVSDTVSEAVSNTVSEAGSNTVSDTESDTASKTVDEILKETPKADDSNESVTLTKEQLLALLKQAGINSEDLSK